MKATSVITRRSLLRQITLLAGASALPAALASLSSVIFAAEPQPTPAEAELAAMDELRKAS